MLVNSLVVQHAFFRIFTSVTHRDGHNWRIKTNSRWNHSAVKIRNIRVKQMGFNCLELLEINNRDRVPVIIRDNVADSRHTVESGYVPISLKLELEIHIVCKTYFPRSLNCSILWTFRGQSLLSQNSSCKICGNWSSNEMSPFLRTSTLVGSSSEQMRCFESTKNFSIH